MNLHQGDTPVKNIQTPTPDPTNEERAYIRQLEEAVTQAECVLADMECARRKGYIPQATKLVFKAASMIRARRRAQAPPSED
jgi:hypothetical protein